MGSVGDSFGNALAENLWMTIKAECIRGRVFATRAEANLTLFEYIDGFYNPRRIQKRLGYLSPIEYEEKHYARAPGLLHSIALQQFDAAWADGSPALPVPQP
ncbi:IS3 family transposase [Streptomyces antimycoticus]|uniref:IS3 family transposase n=1 Tax=Streptomyces antimycoticus TaxID=68175 RepID=UPI003F4DC55D